MTFRWPETDYGVPILPIHINNQEIYALDYLLGWDSDFSFCCYLKDKNFYIPKLKEIAEQVWSKGGSWPQIFSEIYKLEKESGRKLPYGDRLGAFKLHGVIYEGEPTVDKHNLIDTWVFEENKNYKHSAIIAMSIVCTSKLISDYVVLPMYFDDVDKIEIFDDGEIEVFELRKKLEKFCENEFNGDFLEEQDCSDWEDFWENVEVVWLDSRNLPSESILKGIGFSENELEEFVNLCSKLDIKVKLRYEEERDLN